MRISDWSSDVCSSDLPADPLGGRPVDDVVLQVLVRDAGLGDRAPAHRDAGAVHALRIARHQRVPPRQAATLGEPPVGAGRRQIGRAHSELQSLMRISYAVFCLKKKTIDKKL